MSAETKTNCPPWIREGKRMRLELTQDGRRPIAAVREGSRSEAACAWFWDLAVAEEFVRLWNGEGQEVGGQRSEVSKNQHE